MDSNTPSTNDPEALRRKAEEELEQHLINQPGHLPTEDEMRRIIHELSVHQIELENQQKELLQARDELEAGLMRYTDLYDFAPIGYITLAPNGTIQEINLKGASMLGKERRELRANPFTLFLSSENIAIFKSFMRELFSEKGVAGCEIKLGNSGTKPMIVQMNATVSEDRTEGKAVLIDITAQRQAEEENIVLQANLFQAQKIEVVGQLAGGIAHDFNNMLAVILGNAELALNGLEPGNATRDYLEIIQKAATRSAHLTSQLLTFARKQHISPRIIDIEKAIKALLPMLTGLMGENIEVVYNRIEPVSPIYLDPVQFDQILLNLCLNSRDAIKGNGSIAIETRSMQIRQSDPSADVPHSTPGEYVMLTVTDTGSGIRQQDLHHIFEPFFTTKEVGKGTGLGLAVVYGIAKQNHLGIECTSEEGMGTRFIVYLPAIRESESGEAIEPLPAHGFHQETILVVEDHPDICNLIRNILEGIGYDVLVAEDAPSALAISAKYSGHISLLLTDVMLPGMNGVALSEKMKAANPELKTLYISGYSPEIIGRHAMFNENENFLTKPFSIKALQETVHKMLTECP